MRLETQRLTLPSLRSSFPLLYREREKGALSSAIWRFTT
jgi:hypothetical protein